jgi:hypothetical protein
MRATWMFMAMAAVAFPALADSDKAPPTTWQVVSVLEGGSSHTCGDTMVDRFYVELRGDVLRTFAKSSSPNDLKLLGPLNADGSGKVRALNRKNREVTLDFAAGEGPRTIRFTPAYSVCVWSLIPVDAPAKSVTNRN